MISPSLSPCELSRRSRRWAVLLAAALAPASLTASEVEIVVVDGATTLRRIRGVEKGGGDRGNAAGDPVLSNGSFSSGLDGWDSSESGGDSDPGAAVAENAAAVLREGDSFLVTLSQSFQVPANAIELSFTVRLEPGFDGTDDSVPDAFEVSLLDPANVPMVPSWNEEATSFLNFQESGAVHTGPGVEWDGVTATVDLGGVAASESVTLYFDLIGADADVAGAVEIDDVEVTTPIERDFVRGDANLDAVVDIADPLAILFYLFVDGSVASCLEAADAQNDDIVDVADAVHVLSYLFLDGSSPPPPFPSCGPDEGEDDSLGCEDGGTCS